MDGGLSDDPTSDEGLVGGNAASPMSLREAFEQACPVYMQYGMTYDEFWHGDVASHRMYRESYKIKQRERNMNAWLQGRYIYDALCAVSPILRAFSKASKPGKYPEQPYDIYEEQRKARELEEQRKRYEHIKEKVSAFAEAYNKARKEVGENA